MSNKTKAELIKQVKHLEGQRREQYNEIMRLKGRIEEIGGRKIVEQELRQQVEIHQTTERGLTQRIADLEQEVRTIQRNYDGLRTTSSRERDELRDHWSDSRKQVRALEKLLVHNGKAIGALSELAAEKYKNDDLPF